VSLKKKIAIVVDGPDEAVGESSSSDSSGPNVIPAGFFTFGYIAMKYLIVKAYKGTKSCVFICLLYFT
jgi:hypothetical protein